MIETKIIFLKNDFELKPGRFLFIYETIETLIDKLNKEKLFFYSFTTKNYECCEYFNESYYKESYEILSDSEITTFSEYVYYHSTSVSYSINHSSFCFSPNETLILKKIIKYRNGRRREKKKIEEIKGIQIKSLNEVCNLIADICKLNENEKSNLSTLIGNIQNQKMRIKEFFEKECVTLNELLKNKTVLFKLEDLFPVVYFINENYSWETSAESLIRYLNEIRKKGFTILPISFELLYILPFIS